MDAGKYEIIGCLSRECTGIKTQGNSTTIDAEARLAEDVGDLKLRVLQNSAGRFSTELFESYQRSEPALIPALQRGTRKSRCPYGHGQPAGGAEKQKNCQRSYAPNHYPVSSRRSFIHRSDVRSPIIWIER
jgi:hypothetical protein